MAECFAFQSYLIDVYTFIYTNSRGECKKYFYFQFIWTEKWVGCKYYKSYIFDDFVNKHSQVASDLMTHSCQSSGSTRLLMKLLGLVLRCIPIVTGIIDRNHNFVDRKMWFPSMFFVPADSKNYSVHQHVWVLLLLWKTVCVRYALFILQLWLL